MTSESLCQIATPIFSVDELQIPPPKSWPKFERLVRELYRAELNDPDIEMNGRSGQRQKGVDIIGWSQLLDGHVGMQCKVKDQNSGATLTIHELRLEVRKAKRFRPPLKKFIIVTTSSRDANVQEEARRISYRHRSTRHFSVHVCAWDDVVDLLAKHTQILDQFYGQYRLPIGSLHQPLLSEETMTEVLRNTRKSPGDVNLPISDLKVLSASATHALGLIATAPLPASQAVLEKVFPQVQWNDVVSSLLDVKALARSGDTLVVPQATRRQLLPQAADGQHFTNLWTDKLEPLKLHVDMALFLSTIQLSSGKLIESLDTVLNIAEELTCGFWNDVYVDILGVFNNPRFLRLLTSDKRLQFLAIYGTCLSRGETPQRALPYARRLLQSSSKATNHWGVARAYLLHGLIYQYAEQPTRSVLYYEKCITHAKRHRLHFLLGHAYHNLAILVAEDDPAEADVLLALSTSAKRRAGDTEGQVATLVGHGTVAASRGDFKSAAHFFVKASKLAAKWGMWHAEAASLCNVGNALSDSGKALRATTYFTRALKAAEEIGDSDILARAVGGLASANASLKQYDVAEQLFLRLSRIHADRKEHENDVIARQSVGACLLYANKIDQARAVFVACHADAVTHNLPDWIYTCAKDLALSYRRDGASRVVSELTAAAEREVAAGRAGVGARLWESVASVLAESNSADPGIERAFEEAIRALQGVDGEVDERLRLSSGLFDYAWDNGRYVKAIATLESMAAISRETGNREFVARALAQIGSCNAHLRRPDDAMRYLKKALRVARFLPDTEVAETCLNNLGEVLRETGKLKEAVAAFLEAEALARSRGDLEWEASISHNRALALREMGRRSQALRILSKARDLFREKRNWEEYIRAIHGLANLTWWNGEAEKALREYRDVLKLARRYKIADQLASIAINYSNAIWHAGSEESAFRVLESVRIEFVLPLDSLEFFMSRGQLAAVTGRIAKARDNFRLALDAACSMNDSGEIVAAAQGLATVLAQMGDGDGAIRALEMSLKQPLTSEERVSVLTQLLDVTLQCRRRRRSAAVFREIERIVKESGLHGHAVDALVIVADHEWLNGTLPDAFKAYIAAMCQAAKVDSETYFSVGGHLVRQLLTKDSKSQVQDVGKAVAVLKRWLKKQSGGESLGEVEARLLWPFRVSERILGDPRRHSRSERYLSRLVEEEALRVETATSW